MIDDIVKKYNDRDSVFGEKLTNHLTMGLYALHQMGAGEERLREFAKTYTSESKLPPLMPAAIKITEDNFTDYLGQDGLYSSFIPFYAKQLEDREIDSVLRKHVNILIKGSAGGAFHGLIRVAYAYELGEREELAKALAYFAEAYQEFPIPEDVAAALKTAEPLEALSALSDNPRFKAFEFKRPLIVGRMMDIYEDPELFNVLTAIPEAYCTSEDFSDLLLKLYDLTENFTVLHGFTSTHALRVLSRFLTDYPSILKQHWYLVQIAYLSTKCTPINKTNSVRSVPDWPDIFSKAVKSRDVHTIKFVYSLREQSQLFPSDLPYRRTAQGRISAEEERA